MDEAAPDYRDKWTSTAEEFRREVVNRLYDVTDLGELEALARVLNMVTDVMSAVEQLKFKETELHLEHMRIQLAAASDGIAIDDATELETELEKRDATDEDRKTCG